MKITQRVLKSNGSFSILEDVYDKAQHPNQQEGLNKYVDVIDHFTGNVNSVKLYENTKGLHFKKDGSHYLSEFTQEFLYVPFQMLAMGEV